MAERRLIDDCFLHRQRAAAPRRGAGDPARAHRPGRRAETVPLAAAHGRILAETVTSPRNVPAADNAAVDGYAYSPRRLRCRPAASSRSPARVAAGHPLALPHVAGTAARIFTGAIMPDGADTVAMQEDCERACAGRPRFRRDPARPEARAPTAARPARILPRARGRGVRHAAPAAGDRRHRLDRARSVERLPPPPRGARLDRRRDRPPRAPLGARPGLRFQPFPAHRPARDGRLRGDRRRHPAGRRGSRARLRLRELAASHDAVLTTGGASRGEEDHLVTSLDALGKRHLWQLAVKPGRPMSFGQIGDCPVLALPGNPVAAFVCFLLYVRPMLIAMGGGDLAGAAALSRSPPISRSPSEGGTARVPARQALVDEARTAGRSQKFPRDGSGLITSLAKPDGLIEIPEDVVAVRRGDLVTFLPFSGFGLAPLGYEASTAIGSAAMEERADDPRGLELTRGLQLVRQVIVQFLQRTPFEVGLEERDRRIVAGARRKRRQLFHDFPSVGIERSSRSRVPRDCGHLWELGEAPVYGPIRKRAAAGGFS